MLSDYSAVMKAAADGTRARILKLLQRGELCVCQLLAVLGLSSSTVSTHLSILKMAGLVQDRRDGRWVYYSLETRELNPYALSVLGCLEDWLNGEPTMVDDQQRLDIVMRTPLEGMCVVDGRVPLPAQPEAD